MGVLKSSYNTLLYQEVIVSNNFDSIVSEILNELDCVCDATDLDQIVIDHLPNIIIYVDYAVSGFSYRKIELEKIDVLNSDDDHLMLAEDQLTSAIEEGIYKLNCESEIECLEAY